MPIDISTDLIAALLDSRDDETRRLVVQLRTQGLRRFRDIEDPFVVDAKGLEELRSEASIKLKKLVAFGED